MENNFCLNPFTLWNTELEKVCREFDRIIKKDYSGDELFDVHHSMSCDETWITIGIGNRRRNDTRKRVLINLPSIDEFDRSSVYSPFCLKMSFEFFNSKDTLFFEELSNPKVYRTDVLFDEGFIKEILKFFLTRKRVDASYFQKFIHED